MNEISARLPVGALVLDLGCCTGSFPESATAAARLPFGDGCFQAVVSNHSLEHFADLGGAGRLRIGWCRKRWCISLWSCDIGDVLFVVPRIHSLRTVVKI